MANESSLSSRTITVPSIVSSYTDEQLNSEYHHKEEYQKAIQRYGAIYKTVSFSETTDVEKLKEYCKEWIRRNYYDGVLSFQVKAIDLNLLGYNKDKFICGDKIPVEFIDDGKESITVSRTCLSAQYDLLKPENSSYKIGIPDVSSNEKYRDSVNKKVSVSGGAGTGKKVSPIGLGKLIQQQIDSSMEDAGIIVTDHHVDGE